MDFDFVLKFIVLFSIYCWIYILGRRKIEMLIKQPDTPKIVRDWGLVAWLVSVSVLTLVISDVIF